MWAASVVGHQIIAAEVMLSNGRKSKISSQTSNSCARATKLTGMGFGSRAKDINRERKFSGFRVYGLDWRVSRQMRARGQSEYPLWFASPVLYAMFRFSPVGATKFGAADCSAGKSYNDD